MSVYIAATRQNDGKTIVSLGLLSALRKKVKNVGYMKPVGQQYQVIKGKKIDKDAVLMQKIFGFKCNLSMVSPVAIPRGFTEDYILRGKKGVLADRINRAYYSLRKKNDFVLVEGTGHAGVGSVFDLSNADVAALLGLKVVIVSCGGVGRPIDEIMLNYTKFKSKGVEVIGAIVNKVRKEKLKKIDNLVRKGLTRQNIEVLGVVPFKEVLSNPTVSELLEDLGGELVCGEGKLDNVVERFVIGDVIASGIFDHLLGGTLLITPGDREDLIFATLSGWVLGITQKYKISGIIATYGKVPSKRVLDAVKRTNTPLIVVEEDSFSTASKISNMIFKVRAEDKVKISETEALIEKYVDVDKIYKIARKGKKGRKAS